LRERKDAKSQRNFGHGGQGTAGQQGLSHSSVGGASSLRKGRPSTISASPVSKETAGTDGRTATQRAHAGRQDDRNRLCSGANSDSPRKRASACKGASSGSTLGHSQETSGRKLRTNRRRLGELLQHAKPQGLAEAKSAAKWSERPRAIRRKRSQPFSAPVRNGKPQGPRRRVKRSKRERQPMSLYVWHRDR